MRFLRRCYRLQACSTGWIDLFASTIQVAVTHLLNCNGGTSFNSPRSQLNSIKAKWQLNESKHSVKRNWKERKAAMICVRRGNETGFRLQSHVFPMFHVWRNSKATGDWFSCKLPDLRNALLIQSVRLACNFYLMWCFNRFFLFISYCRVMTWSFSVMVFSMMVW